MALYQLCAIYFRAHNVRYGSWLTRAQFNSHNEDNCDTPTKDANVLLSSQKLILTKVEQPLFDDNIWVFHSTNEQAQAHTRMWRREFSEKKPTTKANSMTHTTSKAMR